MASGPIIYRVLIASPSDLIEERDAAAEAIHEWTALHSVHEGIILLPVRSETHATPEANIRPQQVINRDLIPICELMICMFWTRFGSSTGMAESGTVEEIEQFIAAGKPVMMYFSRKPVDPSTIDPGQHKKLKSFRQDTYKTSYCGDFKDSDELKRELNKHLTNTIYRLRDATRLKAKVFDAEAAMKQELEQINRATAEHNNFVTAVLAGKFHRFRGRRGVVTVSLIPLVRPIAAIEFGQDFQQKHGDMFTPMENGNSSIAWMSDGILSLSLDRSDSDEPSLAKLTEFGSIFSVNHWLKWDSTNDNDPNAVWDVPIYEYEPQIISAIYRYFHVLQSLTISGPWWISITLSNVRNLQITTARHMHPLQRPNVLIEDDLTGTCKVSANVDISSPNTLATFIKPALDRIWRGFGKNGDLYFAENSYTRPLTTR